MVDTPNIKLVLAIVMSDNDLRVCVLSPTVIILLRFVAIKTTCIVLYCLLTWTKPYMTQ